MYRKNYGIMSSAMNYTVIWKALLRFIIMAILCAPFGAMFLGIPAKSNLEVQIIFKTLIPAFACGFILFFVT